MLRVTTGWRSVPVLRPHSWHLDQIAEPALPPPPPPSPPCLAPADSPPLPPPPPSAMQLHPGAYSLPWHSNEHSDLSMQWGQLSRPYSSTDRSSSLGSMESLDAPTPTPQTNYDSHNSPVDPALFNNKRDSAYSSFSASSNTSDYATVPLRFGEGSSMENLLQNLGPNGDATGQVLDNGQLIALKSRSLTRPRPKAIEVKERPSSCCYEDERKVAEFVILRNGNEESARKQNPPQPPTRKDSFRATKSRPNVSDNRCTSAPIEITNTSSYFDDSARKSVQNGFPNSVDDKEHVLELYHSQNKAPLTCSKSDAETSIYRPQSKHTANVLHRHSAPEKLLATQLQLLEFDSDNASFNEPFIPPKSTSGSQLSQSERDQDSLHNHLPNSSTKWGGSRCSTPGSVFLEDVSEELTFSNERSSKMNGGTSSPSQVSWGRSVSVPEEPLALLVHKHCLDQLNERDFEPLSSASSVDTLVDKKIEVVEVESSTLKKSSRNLRKNRRRNERFATNLRNEIQRKKAQLQSSRAGPGGLLCSGETVHEEDPDFYEDGEMEVPERKAKVAFAPTTTTATTTPTTNTHDSTIQTSSVDSNCDVLPVQPNTNKSIQIVDPGVPSFGVGIRVVEEPAPAGKARRWRWTPENKLQPENEPQTKRNAEKLFGVSSSRHGVCAFTSSSSTSSHPRSMSCSRMDESDLLPFADRMKFFEETSKTGVSKAAPSQVKPKAYQSESQAGDLGYQSQRRYSYQGGFRQEGSSLMEARRQSVSTKEREERLRQREIERQAREAEFEKARQREKEQEERMRQWERDHEMERQEELERLREMDRLKREKEEMERERQEYFAPRSQESRHHRDDFSSFQPSVRDFEQSQVSRSAFYPVNGPSHHFDNQQHQGFPARSHTPTELYPARQQETTKLNRKYSLTERDYTSRRWESRPADPSHSPQPRWTHRQHDHARSNGYNSSFAPPPAPLRARAMSENDLRFDSTQRWSPSLSVASSQTLSEVEEGPNDDGAEKPKRKKMPPPPRPPPPKWEQFHKRRASHHTFYSSSVPQSNTDDYSAQSSYEPEMSRQRSYSLPPQRQDLSTNTTACPKCNCHQNPPQGTLTHQTSPQNHKQPPPYHPRAQTNQIQPSPLSSDGFQAPYVQSSHQNQPPHVPFDQISNKVQPSHFSAIQIQHSQGSSNEIQPSDNPIPQAQTLSSHKQPSNTQPTNQLQEIAPSFISPSQILPPPSSNQGPPQLPVFTIAPPSPMFSRRAFRPVAPPQRNSRGSVGEEAEEFPPPPPPVADDIDDSLSDSEISHIQDQDQVQVVKTQPISRHTAEWERTPSPTVHSETVSPPPPPPPPSPPPVPNSMTETFHSIDNLKSEFEPSKDTDEHKTVEIEESETTLSPSPAQSLEAELDAPLETDIDDFQEDLLPVRNVNISSELPCLALPVTVLETDLDLLPDHESSPSGKARPDSSLLGDGELEVREEEEEDEGEGSLEEIFPQSSEGESGTESWRGASQNTEHNTDSLDRRSGASSSCSSYYSTSTAKAQLLTQMKDFTESRDRADHDELTYKRQLMESLRKKLGVLREAQRGLQDDIRANTQLGEEVEAMVVSVCKPNEVDKFRMFIGDLDKVVSLMLSLSGRLLRVETTLDTLDSEGDHEERLPLQEKKRQLMRQLSEAQDLKEHVDRREQAVSRVLGRCLSPEQHRDYSHFVKMKAALLVEQRQLEDKIRLGEEQLRGLRESLGLGLGVGMGLAMGYGQY